LPFGSIKSAGKNISEILGIEPINDIEKVDINAKKYEFVYYAASIYETKVKLFLSLYIFQTTLRFIYLGFDSITNCISS